MTEAKPFTPVAHSVLAHGDLAGKTAIITGGGGDIALFYARALGAAGANLALIDLDLGKAQQAAAILTGEGIAAIALAADVGRKAQVTAAVDAVITHFGGVDILINNAGYATTLDFETISEEEFDKVMNANLKGAFFMAQAVLPSMKARGWGRIVNLTSTVSKLGPANLVHYAASKSGVIGFTRALARALGPCNITVNALAPGMVATAPIIALYPKPVLDGQAARRSIKRWMYAEDLIGTLTFLCSKDSDFMTGQTIMADGGQVFD